MKAVIYNRKSTESEDRQMLSLDSQLDECHKIAARELLSVEEVYRESKSAKKPNNRPTFTQMIEFLHANPGQYSIVCWKLNRLARNPIDGGTINWMLQQGIISSIYTINRTYLPTDNVLMMNIEFGMANQFILDLKRDSMRGMKKKAEQGGWNFPAPMGYLNNRIDKTLEIDKDRAFFIKRMFVMRSMGKTYKQIADELNEKGFKTKRGKKLRTSTAELVLKNDFYIGVIRFMGNVYDGIHKPLIEPSLFKKVQEVNEGRAHAKSKRHKYAFNGIFRCGECGKLICGEKQKQFIYYRCGSRGNGCSQGYIRQDRFHESIAESLNPYSISDELFDFVREIEKDVNCVEVVKNQYDINSLSEKINTLQARLERVKEDRYDRIIDSNTYKKDTKKFLAEIKNLEKDKIKLRTLNIENASDLMNFFELQNTFTISAKSITPSSLGGLLPIIASNFLLKDGKVLIEAENEYFRLCKKAQNPLWLNKMERPRTFIIDLLLAFEKIKIYLDKFERLIPAS